MATTLTDLLRTRGIPMASERHKHYKPGWIHVCCPHCGDSGYHLGFAEGVPVGRCFKCGRQNLGETLRLLLNCTRREASDLVDSVCGGVSPTRIREEGESELEEVALPSGRGKITPRHWNYLAERGFDPEAVTRLWQAEYTGPLGKYPWAIIVPIQDEFGRTVSWQARDITGKARAKYRTCPGSDVKRVLYGLDKMDPDRRKVIVTEGVTDVWRLGVNKSVATFGQDWSRDQFILLVKRFDEVITMFDSEAPAQRKAEELCDAVIAMGKEAFNYEIGEGDPGELDQTEADFLTRELLR